MHNLLGNAARKNESFQKRVAGESIGSVYSRVSAFADRKKILEDNDEAAYYSGRVLSSQFFIGAEFPKFFGMVECIMNNEGAAIKVDSANFTGALKE